MNKKKVIVIGGITIGIAGGSLLAFKAYKAERNKLICNIGTILFSPEHQKFLSKVDKSAFDISDENMKGFLYKVNKIIDIASLKQLKPLHNMIKRYGDIPYTDIVYKRQCYNALKYTIDHAYTSYVLMGTKSVVSCVEDSDIKGSAI